MQTLQNSSQQIQNQLNRKVTLLEQYASTLEKQNLAKNVQSQTLYNELIQLRKQNDILRDQIEKLTVWRPLLHQINCSVELGEKIRNQTQENVSERKEVMCQTQGELAEITHAECYEKINQLLKEQNVKEQSLKELSKENHEIYVAIEQLEDKNQTLQQKTMELNNKLNEYSEIISNKTNVEKQNQKLKVLCQQKQKQMRSLAQELDNMSRIQLSERSQKNSEEQFYQLKYLEEEAQKYLRENNRLIQTVRGLEKEKNELYRQLKESMKQRSVSPLRKSNIKTHTSRKAENNFGSYKENSRASENFRLGQQKKKLKQERWKQIQTKINSLKHQNERIRCNLSIL